MISLVIGDAPIYCCPFNCTTPLKVSTLISDDFSDGSLKNGHFHFARHDGVVNVINTLVDHAGKVIDDVGWFWDHANERYVIAHDYLISNYVCASGAHYPIEWRRFRKKDACEKGTFKDHTELCIELIDDAIGRESMQMLGIMVKLQ